MPGRASRSCTASRGSRRRNELGDIFARHVPIATACLPPVRRYSRACARRRRAQTPWQSCGPASRSPITAGGPAHPAPRHSAGGFGTPRARRGAPAGGPRGRPGARHDDGSRANFRGGDARKRLGLELSRRGRGLRSARAPEGAPASLQFEGSGPARAVPSNRPARDGRKQGDTRRERAAAPVRAAVRARATDDRERDARQREPRRVSRRACPARAPLRPRASPVAAVPRISLGDGRAVPARRATGREQGLRSPTRPYRPLLGEQPGDPGDAPRDGRARARPWREHRTAGRDDGRSHLARASAHRLARGRGVPARGAVLPLEPLGRAHRARAQVPHHGRVRESDGTGAS